MNVTGYNGSVLALSRDEEDDKMTCPLTAPLCGDRIGGFFYIQIVLRSVKLVRVAQAGLPY